MHFVTDKANEVWMRSGTVKKPKCIPIHEIVERFDNTIRVNLLGFHALTGCDSTSSFAGHGKTKSWKTFVKEPCMLDSVGRDGNVAEVERFVCSLYGMPELNDIDECRFKLFSKGKCTGEQLPPKRDALNLHFQRSNHQTKVWFQADQEVMQVGNLSDISGWALVGDVLQTVWSSLPAVPKACMSLITCNCKSKCGTAGCSCFKKRMKCMPACGCDAVGCNNPGGD